MILQLFADLAFSLFGLPILIFLLITVTSAFWLWMFVDCLENRAIAGLEKVVWVLVIVFLHFLGALLYFFGLKRWRA